jgi:hypothetical protein
MDAAFSLNPAYALPHGGSRPCLSLKSDALTRAASGSVQALLGEVPINFKTSVDKCCKLADGGMYWSILNIRRPIDPVNFSSVRERVGEEAAMPDYRCYPTTLSGRLTDRRKSLM